MNRTPEFVTSLPPGSGVHPVIRSFAASQDGRLWRRTAEGWREVFEDAVWTGVKTVRAARLVLECFWPCPGPNFKIRFKDGDRQNRAMRNLVWVRKSYAGEVRNEACERVAQGERRKDVAEDLKVHYRTVCEWTKYIRASARNCTESDSP